MNLISILSILILLSVQFSFAQQNIWEPVGEPLEGNTFIVLAIDGDDNLYAGTYFDFFKSTNNGDEWTSIYNGYYVTSIVFNNQGEMFIGGGGGIFKSPDKGETWIHLSDTLINYSITDLDINSNGHLFAAIRGRGIYRSTDDGESWDEIINGLNYFGIIDLYVAKTGPIKDYNFVSVRDLSDYNYIFRSTNNGESWQQTNFYSSWFLTYAFISSSDGLLYSGAWNTAPHSVYGAIFKSEDYGVNWIDGGSDANTTSFVIDLNEYIYAGTESGWMGGCPGIIRTINDGYSWESFNSGLPQGSCGFVLACNSDGILFAGNESGIYRTIESTTDIVENEEGIPSEFTLHQNYPNPFNPSTKIRYELPQSEKVTLKVYDIIGKEIATLVNKEKPAGDYEVNFNANRLASGIYYYTLTAGNFKQSRKMILIK